MSPDPQDQDQDWHVHAFWLIGINPDAPEMTAVRNTPLSSVKIQSTQRSESDLHSVWVNDLTAEHHFVFTAATFYSLITPVKAGVGSFILMSLGKNPIINSKHIIIQVVWENIWLVHLLLALLSGFRKSNPWQETFQREGVHISRSTNADVPARHFGWWKADSMVDNPAEKVAIPALTTTVCTVKQP